MNFNFFGLESMWKHSQEEGLRVVESIKGTDLKEITDPVIECQKRQLEANGWFNTPQGWYHQEVNCSKSSYLTLQGEAEIGQPPLTFNQAFVHLTMKMLSEQTESYSEVRRKETDSFTEASQQQKQVNSKEYQTVR